MRRSTCVFLFLLCCFAFAAADFTLIGSSWTEASSNGYIALSEGAQLSDQGITFSSPNGSCLHKFRQLIRSGFKTRVKFDCLGEPQCLASINFNDVDTPLATFTLGKKDCSTIAFLG